MMRRLRLALAGLLLCPPVFVCAQATLTSTTLSQAVDDTSTLVYLASSSGFSVGNYAFVDREAMLITGIGPGSRVSVLRAVASTGARAHGSGQSIYTGPPNYFLSSDPSGACTAVTQPALPTFTLSSGNQWNCTGGTWVLSGGPFFSGSGSGASCTDSLSPGAQNITWTAGHTYCPNAVGTYTFASAQAVNVNNFTIFCSNPGMVLQFTGATDGFQLSGTNDRIEGCTLDHNSQSGAGTGPLAKITAGNTDLTNIHLQNTGLTNTTSATIFITGGAKHRLRDIYFDGTQTDSGILLAPPTSGTLTDVLIDHVVMNAFNPGASAFQAIYAWDGFNSATGVTISHVTVKNCFLYVQGSNAWGIAKTIAIDAAGHGASNDFNYSDNRVVYKAAFGKAYHWFGNYHDQYHHNTADTAGFSSGAIFDFGDTYYSDIDGNIALNGANAGNTFNFVDGARNTISHNVADGCNLSNECFHFEAGSGIFSDNVIAENNCDVGSYFAGLAVTCYLVTDSSTTAGLNANDNQLIGNHCKGDGTAGQICFKVTNTGTQAVSHTYFTGNFSNNMPTGYSIGASVTNTHISDPHFDTVTSHYAATAPAAASITVNDLTGITFAQIATFFGTAGVNLANGSMMFISDATIANPCATGGNGAMLKRLNAINVCN